MVKHFRLALLWPVRLLTATGALGPQQRPWQVLRDMGEASPWREVEHDLEVEGSIFQERHYNEHTGNVEKKFELEDWPEE